MTKRLKIAAAVLVPLMALGVGFYVFKENDPKIIKESYLKNDLKVGQVVRLKDLVKTNEGYVCILAAYQSRIRNVYDAEHEARIKVFLDETSFHVSYENEVGLIISDSTSIATSIIEPGSLYYRFRVDKKPEMIGWPTGFNMDWNWKNDCLPLDVANLTKISLKNKEFILIGEIK
jgi:hypothetical protein